MSTALISGWSVSAASDVLAGVDVPFVWACAWLACCADLFFFLPIFTGLRGVCWVLRAAEATSRWIDRRVWRDNS